MKIKSLLMTALLLALTVGNMNAQTEIRYSGSLREASHYDQDFEGETIGDWTFVVFEGEGDGDLSEATNHTPEGSSSYQVEPWSADFKGYLISPALGSFANAGFNLEFWYTNYYLETSASYRVGYLSGDMANVDDFNPEDNRWSWGDIINATQGAWSYGCTDCEEGWRQYFDDFSPGTTRIAIAIPFGEGSLFLDDFVFTTISCPKPAMNDEYEAGKDYLTLSWTGSSDNYELRYKEGFPNTFEYGFEGWTTIDDDGDGYTWMWDEEYDGEGHNDDYCVYSESYHDEGTQSEPLTPDNYLVSPLVPLGGSITFWAKGHDESSYEEHFGVAISTDGNDDAEDFETIAEWTATDDWMKYSVDLSNYSGMGYVAIRHFDCEDMLALDVDDITIITSTEWNTITDINDPSYTLENLKYETKYVIQVRSKCDDDDFSSWTDELYAMTSLADCKFINDGEWCDEDNWREGSIPDEESDVIIVAAATIPSTCEAAAGNIGLNLGSITIEDGGQLKHNNEGVVVTMEKNITAYTEGEKDHYYLIATPIDGLDPVDVGMITDDLGNSATPETSTYDFYWFDQGYEAEWQNYRQSVSTSLVSGLGYLYANREDVTLTFNGELKTSGDVSLVYDDEAEFPGWNLVGNPFACKAYIGRDFYRITETQSGSELTTASGAIAPLEGVFVKAEDENDDEISFSREETSKGSVLNVNVIREEADIDVARVRFGEGHNLEKFQLNPNHTKVYFPQNGRNYAVVNAGSIDELPFNFESENDGTFTLSFTQEQVDFSYLHLIDNLTGADVDLLQQPEYTFESKVSDYPSRFRLVFVAKDTEGNVENSESFAFNSNGNFIIVNEGLAILQVIDVQGRMMSSETIDGCVSKKLQAAPGVYVLRLINGDNVMTQKIVVR